MIPTKQCSIQCRPMAVVVLNTFCGFVYGGDQYTRNVNNQHQENCFCQALQGVVILNNDIIDPPLQNSIELVDGDSYYIYMLKRSWK